ncbi:hypothetical protein [Streptomyces sp. NBC_01264]|uniref:hypothetical protein n=1 Tax=Streptomyces sp. NBC_01264 TaxID=2903804 RepID=UPI002257BFD9|nr:hypothetical protein [Streptomyces sp. NBC_01264]MCX4783880.1 hypothetical protein [Streptomyces sp. NBC_01264]
MRTKRIIAAIGGLTLFLTACGVGSKDYSAQDYSFPELPQAVASPVRQPSDLLMPLAQPGDVFHEVVAVGLRGKTLDMANTDGETTARCPADLVLKDGGEAVCVSTFEGLEVEWDVIVGKATDAHGRPVQWSAEPRKGILTRDGAANQVYNNYGGPDLVRCSNIPKAVLVPMLGISGYSCQTVVGGKAGKPMPIEVGLVYPKLQCGHRTREACVG